MSHLQIRPISMSAANTYVEINHRHHSRAQGCKFCLSVYDNDRLCGVAIVGRPIGVHDDDGLTLEVTRCCTDGTKNAPSCLYSAAARVAKAMGYQKIQTFILESESGTSLRASGWRLESENAGKAHAWNSTRDKAHKTCEQLTLFDRKPEITQKKKKYSKMLKESQ